MPCGSQRKTLKLLTTYGTVSSKQCTSSQAFSKLGGKELDFPERQVTQPNQEKYTAVSKASIAEKAATNIGWCEVTRKTGWNYWCSCLNELNNVKGTNKEKD